MLEKQKILMENTRHALELLLDSDDELYPNVAEFERYQIYLSELATEFPNQATLALGLQLMDMIYNAKNQTEFYWIDTIEQATVISLMFSDFSSEIEE